MHYASFRFFVVSVALLIRGVMIRWLLRLVTGSPLPTGRGPQTKRKGLTWRRPEKVTGVPAWLRYATASIYLFG